MGANNFNRRDFLITGCAVAAFAATPIAAATPSDAEKLITRLTKDINKSIEARSSDAALFVQFEKDIPQICGCINDLSVCIGGGCTRRNQKTIV